MEPNYEPNQYNQNPYNQNPYNQNPYNQNPYNQNPYNQNPYNQGQYNQNLYEMETFYDKSVAPVYDGKTVRKASGFIALGVIIYNVIMTIVVYGDMILQMILIPIKYPAVRNSDAEYDHMVDVLFDRLEQSAVSTMIGIAIGLLVLFIYSKNKIAIQSIFEKEKQMTVGAFIAIFYVFMSGQLIFGVFDSLLEYGLNAIGYTAMAQIESATSDSTTISMFIYASFVGPIVEELVYRGFVMKSLAKYGKLMSIFVSSLLFGVMHQNLPQSVFAFSVGLILGYVATEYSIFWSIILHIVNNFVFGEVLDRLIGLLPSDVEDTVWSMLYGSLVIGAIIAIIACNRSIREFFKKHSGTFKPTIYAITAVAFLIFFIGETVLAILALEPYVPNLDGDGFEQSARIISQCLVLII